jgi:hypothetical protein
MAQARPVLRLPLASEVRSASLRRRQVRVVLEPEIAATLEFRAAFHFRASHLVDGLADQLHDVELVESDLGLGQVLGDASDVGTAHVDADLLDVAGVGVVRVDMICELRNGAGAASFGNVDDAARIDVDE